MIVPSFLKRFLHTFIYQVFISNTNNLNIVVWFQVFLFTNNSNNIVSSNYFNLITVISLHTALWFQITNNNNNP